MGKKETKFKQTDIGLIPHDWEVVKLEDITSFPTSTIRSTDINACTYISTENMLQNNLGVLPFNGEVLPSNVREYKRGDILVSNIRPYLRKSYLATQSGGCSSDVIVFRPHGKVHSDYLYTCVSSCRYATEVTANSTGTKMPRGCLSFIRQFQVPLPPIKEQKRIAEVLSHFDEHIDNLVALLEKRKQVKAATMQALLSGTTRLPGFTAPWQERSLSELFSFARGNGLSKSAVGDKGEYPCILYGQLFTTYKENIQSVVSYTDLEEGVLSKKGDVLMPASTTTSGEDLATASALQYDGVRLGGDIIVLRPKQVMDSLFMAYIIRLLKDEITALAQGITIVHISGKRMLSLEVMIPTSVDEQSAIVDILSNMDRGIEALEEQIEKYRQMKEGAMEELLTGKVRLI